MKTATKAFFDEFCSKLVEWSLDDEAIHFTQYCAIQGISMLTFDHWCDKYPAVKEAKQIAMDFIAGRREQGAIFSRIGNKPVSGGEIGRYQSMYCRKYKDELKWKAGIATPDKFISGKQIVVIEKISLDEPIVLEPTDE